MKNIAGIDITEWKILSGLTNPYSLAFLEASVQAGVPAIVEEQEVERLWLAFLEHKGSSSQEFGHLLTIAAHSGDDELMQQLTEMKRQFDEDLASMANKAAMKIGKLGGTLAAKTVGRGFAPPAAPSAPEQPKQDSAKATTPSADAADKSEPAADKPEAETDAPATKQTDTGGQVAGGDTHIHYHLHQAAGNEEEPEAEPEAEKPSIGGGLKKIGSGLLGMVNSVVPRVSKAPADDEGPAIADKATEEALEQFIQTEFGLSAEEFVEICDRAYATNDLEMIECAHKIDQAFAAWLNGDN